MADDVDVIFNGAILFRFVAVVTDTSGPPVAAMHHVLYSIYCCLARPIAYVNLTLIAHNVIMYMHILNQSSDMVFQTAVAEQWQLLAILHLLILIISYKKIHFVQVLSLEFTLNFLHCEIRTV